LIIIENPSCNSGVQLNTILGSCRPCSPWPNHLKQK